MLTLELQLPGGSNKPAMAAPVLFVWLLSISVGKVEWELELTDPARIISLIVLNFEEKVGSITLRLKYWGVFGKESQVYVKESLWNDLLVSVYTDMVMACKRESAKSRNDKHLQ